MYFDSTFLFPCLGIASDTLEKQVGEQRDCRGVDNLQLSLPFWSLVALVVRGKHIAMSGIQMRDIASNMAFGRNSPPSIYKLVVNMFAVDILNNTATIKTEASLLGQSGQNQIGNNASAKGRVKKTAIDS